MRSDVEDYLDRDEIPEDLNVEEFNQIGPAVLRAQPRGPMPLNLYRYRKKLNSLVSIYAAGAPMPADHLDHLVHLADQGRLFFSRNDQEIYARCAGSDPDAALDDPNLTPEDLAGILVSEIARRQKELFEHAMVPQLERLVQVVDSLAVYVGVDYDNIDHLVSVSHRNRDRERQRVNAGVIALVIYLQLNRDKVVIENLAPVSLGFFLYDIGMSRVSRLMTEKTSQLSATERRKLKEHPRDGLRILEKLGLDSEEVLEPCQQHHERIDGSGYPGQLKGKEIGLYGRIAAVADSFCAMITDRPHSARRNTVEAAVELLKMDRAYDHRVCRALVQYLQGIPG